MPAPEHQAAAWGEPTQLQQPQSTFVVISSRRCAQPAYSAKDIPLTLSALKRVKARIQALTTAPRTSKPSQPKNSYESLEQTRPLHSQPEPTLETWIQDRLKAIGACSAEPVTDTDTEEPIPNITIPAEAIGAYSVESVADTEKPVPVALIPEETPNDTPTKPFDVHTTLLGHTAARLVEAKAFNLGLPSTDRELMKSRNEISRAEEGPGIMWSLEGTYIPRGVPKGRVTRFVETGLLEVEEETGLGVETSLEAQSEEDSLVAESAALAVEMSTKSVRGRVRDIWKTRRQGREGGG
ncbi:hypothetical protein VE03_05563 [Pseudogymnoascus sp. 23342-1-I1]|nr:hypothetical protein VE03_05563 [Pseudogymnoascus sp. 23342-1-I1]